MLSRKATLLVILVVLSLSVQNSIADLPNYTITPHALVYMQRTGDNCVVRIVCESQCYFNTGAHPDDANHWHRASALLQVYIHEPGGYPRNDEIATFLIK